MQKLSKDWLVEKHVDLEYKKYVLLAYLQEVSNNYDKNVLYPFLADLIEHYKQLIDLKNDTDKLTSLFPSSLRKMDLKKFQMVYQSYNDESDLIKELKEIIQYSIPQFEVYLKEGKKIYDFVEQKLYISPVGLIPLYSNEGYMLLSNGNESRTNVFEYQISVFEKADVKYRGIHTQFISTYERNLSTTYEYIKRDLIRSIPKLPNPATFAVEIDLTLPLEPTLLPIAKQALVKYISQEAA